jgi:hypothetical protein
MTSYRINNLLDPSSTQDAATKSYVDTATAGIATTSAVTTAITNALNNGSMVNNPTVASAGNASANYNVVFSNTSSGRAGLLTDGELFYNPNANILYATTFSGTLDGGANHVKYGIYQDGWRLYCTAAGYIGIGTTTPAYPLDIAGKVIGSGGTKFYWFGGGSQGNYINSAINLDNVPIAIRAKAGVWVDSTEQYSGFWATSDRRIKKNINYNIASECLNIFRKLKCSNYSFVDEREHKINVYGYIAQDVSTVLPYAVTTQTGFIPSLYSLAKISRENGIIKITCSEQKPYIFHSLHDKDGTAFVTDKNEPASDKDGGRHFKVKLFDVSMNEFIVKITQIVDNGVFTIDNDEISVKLTDTEYFVFGQEVDDYKILNNEAITVVATAVLQEVDRQQQADKVRIAELEATVIHFESKMVEQQTLINDILERLKTLEKA